MTTINPTVGRVVLYFHRGEAPPPPPVVEGEEAAEAEPAPIIGPQAAILCAVNEDGTINVSHFDASGVPRGAVNVVLLQDGDEPDDDLANWCEWMPYQKGQAAKTEQLERRLGSGG